MVCISLFRWLSVYFGSWLQVIHLLENKVKILSMRQFCAMLSLDESF